MDPLTYSRLLIDPCFLTDNAPGVTGAGFYATSMRWLFGNSHQANEIALPEPGMARRGCSRSPINWFILWYHHWQGNNGCNDLGLKLGPTTRSQREYRKIHERDCSCVETWRTLDLHYLSTATFCETQSYQSRVMGYQSWNAPRWWRYFRIFRLYYDEEVRNFLNHTRMGVTPLCSGLQRKHSSCYLASSPTRTTETSALLKSG